MTDKLNNPHDKIFREILGHKQEAQSFLQHYLPLVFYHGLQRWTVSTQFAEIWADYPPELKPYIPHFTYHLVDLSEYSDEELKGNVILQVFMRLVKYIFREDLGEQLWELVALLEALSKQETGLRAIETYLTYLVRGTDKVEEEEVVAVFKKVLSEKGEALMASIAEQWLEQGIVIGEERGIAIGEERGKAEGIAEGERQALLKTIERVLFFRFEVPSEDLFQDLGIFKLDALKYLSELVFKVETLPEFIAEFKALHPNNPEPEDKTD